LINSVNLVYEQVLKENGKRERKPRHYPSSACAVLGGKFAGHCRRSTWYEWKGLPRTDPPDAPALFKMGVGNLIHEELDGYLERALLGLGYRVEDIRDTFPGNHDPAVPQDGGGLVEVEAGEVGNEVSVVWLEEGLKYPFSGRMDKRFISPEGLRVVAEWKSTYGRGIDDIKQNGPKVEALLQVTLYLRQKVFPVDAAILMYAARDSGYLFGYWITAADGKFQIEHMNSSKVDLINNPINEILSATRMLEEYLDGEEPPPCDFTEKDWQCRYCSYARLCRGRA
jgi:CRISPR/Cas system-associated exonuclease Cas4 (RecB family)